MIAPAFVLALAVRDPSSTSVPLWLEVILTVIGVIGACVLIYVYFVSKLRQSTSDLQEQANAAQEQLIEAMRVQLAELSETVEKQADELRVLREQVTHAAEVAALKAAVEAHTAANAAHFETITRRFDELVSAKKSPSS